MFKRINRTLCALSAAVLFTLPLLPGVSSAALTKAELTGETDASLIFTDRDLDPDYDAGDAEYITVSDGGNVTLDSEGVYVFTGTAAEYTVTVAADSTEKVQIVLDGVSVTNSCEPVICAESADKVFVTVSGDSVNVLAVTGDFDSAVDSRADGVIFSREDLVLNGTGSLEIVSSDNAVVCKDDLKITGGTYTVSCAGKALEANDGILFYDGSLTVTACDEGIECRNDDDDSLGYVVIFGGSIDITASGNGIQAGSVVRIDGGSVSVAADDGIEGACILLTGGSVAIAASDDGINASGGSSVYDIQILVSGGSLTVSAGREGDALDSDGTIGISGGTVSVTAVSAFKYGVSGTITGGTVTVNGTQVTAMGK